MTADADVTVTFTAGDAPFATVTTTLTGDGGGTLWADGKACSSGSCAVKYLVGSSVQLTAAGVGTARFTGYSSGAGGASSCGLADVCTFTLNADSSVTGTFLALTSFTVAPSSAIGVPGGPSQTFTVTGTYSSGPTAAIASASGAWSAATSLPAGRADLAAATLGGKVYAIGGTDGAGALNGLTEFDPATLMWTPRASMLVSRAVFGAAPAGGQLYALGGANGFFGDSTPLASVERYDPTTDAWTMRAPMAAPRQGLAAGTINGIIYAAGGLDSEDTPLATLEAYDPASDTWAQKPPMPTPRWLVAGGVIDGILYVVGGSNGSSIVSTVEAYNPATNTWTTRAPLPVPLAGAAAAVADGVLYVMAGQLYQRSVVYAYDPVADAWTVKAPMLTPLNELAAVSLNGVVYAIGGSSTDLFHSVKASSVVQTFVDSLRWSSSAPSVVRIAQTGAATPLAPGTATITANVGGTTCGAQLPGLHRVAADPTVARSAGEQQRHQRQRDLYGRRLGAQPRRPVGDRRRCRPRLRGAGRRAGDLPRRRGVRRRAPGPRRRVRRAVHQQRVHADGRLARRGHLHDRGLRARRADRRLRRDRDAPPSRCARRSPRPRSRSTPRRRTRP